MTCAPLIHARLDVLVHMPAHIRAHIVIEHPQTMAGRTGLFEWHHPFLWPTKSAGDSVRQTHGRSMNR